MKGCSGVCRSAEPTQGGTPTKNSLGKTYEQRYSKGRLGGWKYLVGKDGRTAAWEVGST